MPGATPEEGEPKEHHYLMSILRFIAEQDCHGSTSSRTTAVGPPERELSPSLDGGWSSVGIEYILRQESDIKEEEGKKMPLLGDKEHVLETQDRGEVDRIKANIKECRNTLRGLGYPDFVIQNFFQPFIELLDCVLQGSETFISCEKLLQRSRDQDCSDAVVMFFRCVTSAEVRRRSDFFKPFILGLTNGIGTVDEFCRDSVELMGEESDHVHITALSDALGVSIRVVYLDRSSCNNGVMDVNHHDFIPSSVSKDHQVRPFVHLLYRPGHYDIIYPK